MNYQDHSQSQGQQEDSMAKPDSNLVWAILCTVLCCMPLGIVSIVYATKVDSLWTVGSYHEAYDASSKAKKWALWGAIGGAVCLFLYIIAVMVFGFANALFNS